MTTKPEPVLLDLSDFKDPERARALAGAGCPQRYHEVVAKYLNRTDLTLGYMLFGSFVVRMRGLHEGVVREITAGNPHAALPLLRAWVEVITIGLYILRKPNYVDFLLYGHGPNRGNKSFQAMFDAVREDAGQLKAVYSELSAYSHFNSLAVWNVFTPTDDGKGFSWTDKPRWRDERHFQTACAQAHELAHAGLEVLDRLGNLLLSPGSEAGSDPLDHA